MMDFLFLALLALPTPPTSRAANVEVIFSDGVQQSRFRVPIPLDNQQTRARFSERGYANVVAQVPGRRFEVSLRAMVVKDKSGASWLDYDIKRSAMDKSAPSPKDALPFEVADVDVSGVVPLGASGPITIGEQKRGAAPPLTVQLEVVRGAP